MQINKDFSIVFNGDAGERVLKYLNRTYNDVIPTNDAIEMARAVGARDVVLEIQHRIEEFNNGSE